MKFYTSKHNQQGTALVVSLLILIIMTLVVLAGSQNTSLQLRMSSNLESRIEAQQMAQAGLDFATTLTAAQIAGATTVCSIDNPNDNLSCDISLAMLPVEAFDSSSWFHLKEDDTGLAGGCGRAMGISIETFECTFYKGYSTYDNTSNGRGRSTIGSGMVRIVPAGT